LVVDDICLGKMSRENLQVSAQDSVCALAAVSIKTWLEVPADRLCNATTLCDRATRMMRHLCPATGKV
jgi:hypothetical protein